MELKIKQAAIAFGIMALAFTSCRKETTSLNPSLISSSENDIELLVTQTKNESDKLQITFNQATNEIAAVNEGIAADYLVTENDFTADLGSDPSSSTSNDKGSFIDCLKGLKLDNDQTKKVRIILAGYEDCKSSAIKRARAIHAQLVEKYKELAAEQAKLLSAQKITKAQYEERIARLRQAFEKELKALQLEEKLNEALKDCHTKFLRQLNGILTERQWKAFIECYKK